MAVVAVMGMGKFRLIRSLSDALEYSRPFLEQRWNHIQISLGSLFPRQSWIRMKEN